MMKKSIKSLLVALVFTLAAATAYGNEPASVMQVPEDGSFVLAGEAQVPQVCASGVQAFWGVPACTTCGVNSWCDQWCGAGLGVCAPNSTCGGKKYCSCIEF